MEKKNSSGDSCISEVTAKLDAIERELIVAYSVIGKKYVDYIVSSGEKGPVDISELLDVIEDKKACKEKLRMLSREKEST